MPIGELLLEELKKHREVQELRKLEYGEVYEDGGLVCADEIGRFLNPSNLSRHFQEILDKAGLKHVRFHDLRHSHLTALISSVNLKIISSRAGHSNISTTGDVYSHPDVEMGRVAAVKFDELLAAAAEKLKKKQEEPQD